MTVRSNYMVDGAPLARAARHPLGTVSAKGNIGHPLRWFELLSCASPRLEG